MRMGTVRVGVRDAVVGAGDGDGEATDEGETRGVGAADGAADGAVGPGPTDGVADAISALPVEGAWRRPLDIAAGVGVTIGPSATVPPPRQPATKRTVAAAAARPARRRRAGRRSTFIDPKSRTRVRNHHAATQPKPRGTAPQVRGLPFAARVDDDGSGAASPALSEWPLMGLRGWLIVNESPPMLHGPRVAAAPP